MKRALHNGVSVIWGCPQNFPHTVMALNCWKTSIWVLPLVSGTRKKLYSAPSREKQANSRKQYEPRPSCGEEEESMDINTVFHSLVCTVYFRYLFRYRLPTVRIHLKLIPRKHTLGTLPLETSSVCFFALLSKSKVDSLLFVVELSRWVMLPFPKHNKWLTISELGRHESRYRVDHHLPESSW